MNDSTDTGINYRIRRQGRVLGPFSESQINRMISRQKLGLKDEIKSSGNDAWQRVEQWRLERETARPPQPQREEAAPHPPANAAPQSRAAEPASASQASTGEWYVVVGDGTEGPFDENTLGQLIGQGRIDAETLVWRKGMQDWRPAHEMLPAVMSAAHPPSGFIAVDVGQGSNTYRARDLRARKAFWVLTCCVITYILAAESFAAGIFLIYSAVATRRLDNNAFLAVSVISILVFACLFLMTAIEMTKLRSNMGRIQSSDGSDVNAHHEHRVWLFGGLAAAFVIVNQIGLAIYFLIVIAEVT